MAEDDGRLFQTWKHARLIDLEKEHDLLFAFMHPTLQEYLAGQELGRRIRSGDVDVVADGMTPLWMQSLVFAASALDDDSPLWTALRDVLETPDEFGVLLLRAASLLIERGVRDGGEQLLGQDITPMLWDLFMRAPDGLPYADALVQLAPDFAAVQAQALGAPNAQTLPRLMLLFARMSPQHAVRSQLIKLTALTQLGALGSTSFEETELEDLPTYLHSMPGFSSAAAPNLESAGDVRSVAELVAQLGEVEGPTRKSLRIRLALTQSQEAEATLVEEFASADEVEDLLELLEALATLGTLAGRNAILDRLRDIEQEPQVLEGALHTLQKFPIAEGADLLLDLAQSGATRAVRVKAAIALGGALSDAVLKRLADHAKIDVEDDVEMRKAVLEALARAGASCMARTLATEDRAARDDPSERLVVAGYLAEIMRRTPPHTDLGHVRKPILEFFECRLRDPDVESLEITHAASCGESETIRTAMHAIASQHADTKRRAAAIRALREIGDEAAPETAQRIVSDLAPATTIDHPEAIVLREAALTVAFTRPELLLPHRTNPIVERALWRFSLESDVLIFADKAITLSEFRASTVSNDDPIVETIEDFFRLDHETADSIPPAVVRQILGERAERYSVAFDAAKVDIRSLSTRQLQRELRVIRYCFIDHDQAYTELRKAAKNNEAAPATARKSFEERVVEEATGIPKTSLRQTVMWAYVRDQLRLGRQPSPPRRRVGMEGVEASHAAPQAEAADRDALRQAIRASSVSTEEAAALLQALDSLTPVEKVSKMFDLIRRRDP